MIERVRQTLGDLPYMRFEQAEVLSRFLHEHKLRNCLELGFFHGVSSAYIAETLREMGGGHLTTIDLEWTRSKSPNIDAVLAQLDLTEYVTVYYEPRSYTWRMMKMIEAGQNESFDFCYIDGGHLWDVSGFGFFLVEKLVKPGGWVLFDDLDWRVKPYYDRLVAEGKEPEPWMQALTAEERETKQVRKIWELLVKQHPRFANFGETEFSWGFTQKVR